MSDSCDLMGCSPPGSSVYGALQAEQWSGLPFPSPGDLPDPGTEPRSPALQADSLLTELPAAAAAKLLQLCPTLCDPMDCSPPGSWSLGFSRQEHWSGFPCPPPADLRNPEIEPQSRLTKAFTRAFPVKNQRRT